MIKTTKQCEPASDQEYFEVIVPPSDLRYFVTPDNGLSIKMPIANDGDLLGEALRVDLEILRQRYELSVADLDFISDNLADLVLSRIVLQHIGNAIAYRGR